MCGYLRLVVCDDDVAMQDEGATALWIASQNGHAEVVAALLASGWLLKMGGNRKFTIKHWQVGTAVFPAARHVCPARWSWSVWRARRVLRLRV